MPKLLLSLSLTSLLSGCITLAPVSNTPTNQNDNNDNTATATLTDPDAPDPTDLGSKSRPTEEEASVSDAPTETASLEERFNFAVELLEKRKYKDAESTLKALILEAPNRPGLHANLGLLYAKTKRNDDAIAELQTAVKLKPSMAVAQNALGVLHRKAKQYQQAETAYRAALASQPEYADAHRNMGILYAEFLNNPEQARTHYQRYLDLSDKDQTITKVWVAEITAKLQPATSSSPNNTPVRTP